MTSVRLGCVFYPRTRDVYIESNWVVFLYLPEVDRNEWKLFEIYKHAPNICETCENVVDLSMNGIQYIRGLF